MALGEYRPPNQIHNDEDKYWKFTKTQIIYSIVGLFLGLIVFFVLGATGLVVFKILGALLTIIFIAVGIAIGGLTIPNSKYLTGGGLRVDKYLFRKIKKKFLKKKKIVYTRNIDRDKLVTYRSASSLGDDGPNFFEDLKSMFGGE